MTLIFSLERYGERRRDRVPARRRASRRIGRRPVEGDLRRLVLRVEARHRGRCPARGARRDRPRGQARDREREARLQALRRGLRRRRWGSARSRGRDGPAPLWASTSTKNPAYRDVMYVEELIGPHTVNTMPLETLEAFRDHGEVRGSTVTEDVGAAERLLADLAEAGRRLRRPRRQARERGRPEVWRLLRRADLGHRSQTERAGGWHVCPWVWCVIRRMNRRSWKDAGSSDVSDISGRPRTQPRATRRRRGRAVTFG